MIIPSCEHGVIPSSRAIKEGANAIDEERRLFYVALTRAKDSVAVTLARTRKPAWGKTMVTTSPSQFIQEAGIRLKEVE